MPALRCQATKDDDGTPCCGYAGRVPYPVRFVRIVEHDSDAAPANHVNPCQRCGALNVYAPEWSDDLREAA